MSPTHVWYFLSRSSRWTVEGGGIVWHVETGTIVVWRCYGYCSFKQDGIDAERAFGSGCYKWCQIIMIMNMMKDRKPFEGTGIYKETVHLLIALVHHAYVQHTFQFNHNIGPLFLIHEFQQMIMTNKYKYISLIKTSKDTFKLVLLPSNTNVTLSITS